MTIVPAGLTAPRDPDRQAFLLRAGVAFVWLATGLLVLHPYYRSVGEAYLAPLGLGAWAMYATCAVEIVLGLRVLARPVGKWLSLGQAGMVAAFTLILAVHEPMLLAHPMGVLSKNLPILACIGVIWLVETEGWTTRALWLLRAGMASVWLTEGIVPKLLFQQSWELELVAKVGIPWDPSVILAVIGVAEALSGVAALLLRGRLLRALLLAQMAALIVLPIIVVVLEPHWLAHPFGPLTKNVTALLGTYVVVRCSSSS